MARNRRRDWKRRVNREAHFSNIDWRLLRHPGFLLHLIPALRSAFIPTPAEVREEIVSVVKKYQPRVRSFNDLDEDAGQEPDWEPIGAKLSRTAAGILDAMEEYVEYVVEIREQEEERRKSEEKEGMTVTGSSPPDPPDMLDGKIIPWDVLRKLKDEIPEEGWHWLLTRFNLTASSDPKGQQLILLKINNGPDSPLLRWHCYYLKHLLEI